MYWIYLSPHLDDAALSCGGMIWEQTQSGERVEIWTIFAGDPPPGPLTPFASSLHDRWGTGRQATAARRKEDIQAAGILGAAARHFDLADCIYRRLPVSGEPLIQQGDDLWQPPHPDEAPLVHELRAQLLRELPEGVVIVSPLGIGKHIDHSLVRNTAEKLPVPIFFYPDYPYVDIWKVNLDDWEKEDWSIINRPVSLSGLQVWKDTVAAYISQISTFWGNEVEMRAVLESYWRSGGGSRLYQPPS